MKHVFCTLILSLAFAAFAEENIIYDDGTGAQISFRLPTQEITGGKNVVYSTFNLSVVKDDKFLLLCTLTGQKSADGNFFVGTIVIPSAYVDSAVIRLLGAIGNSSVGVDKKLKVRDFKIVKRKKSWTEQE